MKRALFVSIVSLIAFSLTTYGFAGDATFETIKYEVIDSYGRCSDCHGQDKDEPKLTYKMVKRALKGMSEDEIKEDAWFPVAYCNGPLDEIRREIVIEWFKAGMPE